MASSRRRLLRASAAALPVGFCAAAGTYRWTHRPSLPEHELLDLRGRRVVLTGGTSGVGRAVAADLAGRGARVIVGCRDAARGEALRAELPGVLVEPLDLGQLASVDAFAAAALRHFGDVELVVCSAAEIRCAPEKTPAGFDATFAANHLGPQQLLARLTPALLRGATPQRHARVVLVGSTLERRGHLDLDALEQDGWPDPRPAGQFDPMRNYASSKLANTLLASELHRRMQERAVDVFIVSPGMVHTNLWGNFPGWYRAVTWPVRAAFLRSPEDAAMGVVFAAAAGELEGRGGQYLKDGWPLERSERASDGDLAKRLYESCERLIEAGRPIERCP